jgi:2-polyprenyl-3-methyl-5-hydroxy-6-metoxy-1,4-benzoquinol methylase
VWIPLARYLQRYVPRDGAVLDIATDRGHFIRNISAAERWATDVRDASAHIPDPIRFVQSPGLELAEALPNGHFDAIVMSNYLEHLESHDAVITQLQVARTLARPGGTLIVLQPNIRFVGHAYWDFIDHRIALTHRSLEEAADLAGWETVRLVRRFMPYTTKSRLPRSTFVVRAYLALPPLWRVFGKQTLYVGRRRD